MLLNPLPPAPEVPAPSRYISFILGQSKEVLGTSETRVGMGFSYGYGRTDRRLTWQGMPGELVHTVTGYTSSGTAEDEGEGGISYTASARYLLGAGKARPFFDIGWGILYTSNTSVDINASFNSTPYLGFGVQFRIPDGDLFVQMRWFHISNAGIVPPNHGQNYLNLLIGLRYR